MASKLVITRKGEWLNRRQRFKVFIDGKESGAIKNDSSEEFELQPGTHTVQCKLNWMSSNEFTANVTEGKNTFLLVSSGMKYYWPLYIMLLLGIFLPYYFKLAKLPKPQWLLTVTLILIIPAFLYLLYFATLNRKKYLLLKQDDSNPFM